MGGSEGSAVCAVPGVSGMDCTCVPFLAVDPPTRETNTANFRFYWLIDVVFISKFVNEGSKVVAQVNQQINPFLHV